MSVLEKNKIIQKQGDVLASYQKLIDANNQRIEELTRQVDQAVSENTRLRGHVTDLLDASQMRTAVQYCTDFAVRSLPWWKRTPDNIINTASRIYMKMELMVDRNLRTTQIAVKASQALTKQVLDGPVTEPEPTPIQ